LNFCQRFEIRKFFFSLAKLILDLSNGSNSSSDEEKANSHNIELNITTPERTQCKGNNIKQVGQPKTAEIEQ
jgi:hypothetical protein